MTTTTRSATDAELALLGCWAVARALRTLLAHGLALVLLLAGWRPSARAAAAVAAPMATEPTEHPLQGIAAQLQAMTCRELQQLAGTRRKLRKEQLVALVLAG